jgi:protein involved in polysaccharide export with SLBB domain
MASDVLTRVLAVLAAGFIILSAGCARKDVTPLEDVLREESASGGTPAYLLRPGDHIEIDFAADNELDFDAPITPSGTIALPMAGEIPAAGMTVDELAVLIADRMSAYLLDPKVSVLIQGIEQQYVYVIGEVKDPGRLEVSGGMTVTAALAGAGGIVASGRPSSVMIVRTRGVEEPLAFKVDVTKVLSARDMSHDVPLRENDVVYVPKSVIGQADQFVDLFFNKIAPAQLFYLRGYDMAHLKDSSWRF